MARNINGYAAYRPSVSPHFSQRLSPQQSDAIRQLAERNAASPTHSASDVKAVREISLDDPALDFTEKLLKNQLTEEFVSSPISITEMPLYSFDIKAEDVALNYISQHYQKGLSEGKTSNELNKLIDNSAEHYRNAYRNTSSILEKLGKLGPKQQSFISRSEHRVELGVNAMYNFPEVKGGFGQPVSEPFELTIKTQEGDRVTVTFSVEHTIEKGGMEYAATSSKSNSFDSFELSYQVEGDLSDEEYSAMMEIFAGAGQLADDYFTLPQANQDKAILSNDLLANFNSEQLAGVDLSMSSSKADIFSYSYSFDKGTEQQRLAVETTYYFARPLSFDITTSIWGGQDSEQLAQYFDAIDKDADKHQHNLDQSDQQSLTRSIEGYKTALSSMLDLSAKHTQLNKKAEQHFMGGRQLVTDLTNQLIRKDERYQKLATTDGAALKEGLSSLADFKTSFKYGVEKKEVETETDTYFKFKQKQETTVISDARHQGVKQSKSHQSNGQSLKGKTLTTEQSERYTVKAAVEGQQVVGLDQTFNADSSEMMHARVGGGINAEQKIDTEDSASSSIRLIEDIWTQSLSDKSKREENFKLLYGKEVAFHNNEFTQDAHEKMVIIGDQDKLNSQEFLRQKYAPKLNKVNHFMESV